ncbi:adenylate/guanylate cyclase domain-containing protein [Micrococcus sp.]|uniref:adenylate/guanylate cyclase domain-containing protein n=1 Tax=Micrococcus sp. TaxID=1271 RepID=UPI002A9094A3|nr:adenylate/guanylate cyclase domain-containing protein [Micrococcus sp.]MDY6054842.1 adenylate/guanylate cyclase domain-containing protein [Micrococcus sp.]
MSTDHDTDEHGWATAVRALDAGLVAGRRVHSLADLSARFGMPVQTVRRIGRALGYTAPQEGAPAFSEEDAEALGAMVGLVQDGVLNEETALSLARSIGQLTDRMVVWQIEALVEDKISTEGMGDPAARRAAVGILPRIIAPVEETTRIVYRRQLSAAVQRLTVRVEAGLAASERGRDGSEDDAPLPLARAVGFADMVSYTTRSRHMDERALARTVQRFESRCAEIISSGGGWLVKTIGDEVLFNAETPEAGALIALELAEAISSDPQLPSARVALTWGRVLSRLGDIYGPTVNLASRLTSLADPGTVLVDAMTAAALAQDERFVFVPQPPRMVRGFGEVHPSLLMSGSTQTPLSD